MDTLLTVLYYGLALALLAEAIAFIVFLVSSRRHPESFWRYARVLSWPSLIALTVAGWMLVKMFDSGFSVGGVIAIVILVALAAFIWFFYIAFRGRKWSRRNLEGR